MNQCAVTPIYILRKGLTPSGAILSNHWPKRGPRRIDCHRGDQDEATSTISRTLLRRSSDKCGAFSQETACAFAVFYAGLSRLRAAGIYSKASPLIPYHCSAGIRDFHRDSLPTAPESTETERNQRRPAILRDEEWSAKLDGVRPPVASMKPSLFPLAMRSWPTQRSARAPSGPSKNARFT
jgi:hypothetical protein